MANRHFYANLPIHRATLSALLDDESHFDEVPGDWHVIVTDIKNSTIAFKAGRSEEINLIATGCIIATLNLAQKQQISIPFFFGGDGATLIVPPELLAPALRALKVHRANTITNFGLELRVGSVPVVNLQEAEQELLISRIYISDAFSIPIFLGNGLAAAEKIIKAQNPDLSGEDSVESELDLNGMECRWDKVKPAVSAHEVVSLLVSNQQGQKQAQAFKQVVDLIDEIYGPHQLRNPVSRTGLQLKGTLEKIGLEMRTRLGGFNFLYLMKHWILTKFGAWFFFSREAGQQYVDEIVELTDTLVIDGRINTVIAGTTEQRRQLEEALNTLETAGLIHYGLFVSNESVMSCYVRDRKDKHIHFVDGADGGYTMAAKVWKQKLARNET
ncbi:MAG: DUF3095 family protein [Rhodothermales bacterium]